MLVSKKNRGFTLIELSIVITIIALIVAGVVAGQNLVVQGKLRSVITDIDEMKVALNTFRIKYDALPGDIPNAFDYWGSDFSCTDALATVNSTGCNGDGDGLIENVGAENRHESYRAWQQLAHADIISGTYTGQYSLGFDCQPDINSPKIFETGGMTLNNNNTLLMGAPTVANNCRNALFTSFEASSIDQKIDDGVVDAGVIIGDPGQDGVCLSGSEYDFSITTVTCTLSHVAMY